MFKILILFFLFFSTTSFSQNEVYKKNIWYSIIWKHQINANWNISLDIGHRTFDEFVQRKRQNLVRVIVDRKLNDRNSIGLGFAYFESVKQNSTIFVSELRPFIQYLYQFRKEKSTVGIRFRNELRYFTDKKSFVDRSRLQVSYEYKVHSAYFIPKLSIEGFVSAQKSPLIEQRYSVGVTTNFSKLFSMYLFYTLQYQSNLRLNARLVAQNIIGFQLIINTVKNVK